MAWIETQTTSRRAHQSDEISYEPRRGTGPDRLDARGRVEERRGSIEQTWLREGAAAAAAETGAGAGARPSGRQLVRTRRKKGVVCQKKRKKEHLIFFMADNKQVCTNEMGCCVDLGFEAMLFWASPRAQHDTLCGVSGWQGTNDGLG